MWNARCDCRVQQAAASGCCLATLRVQADPRNGGGGVRTRVSDSLPDGLNSFPLVPLGVHLPHVIAGAVQDVAHRHRRPLAGCSFARVDLLGQRRQHAHP